MKLVCYDSGDGPRAGVLGGDSVFDAAALLDCSAPLPDVRALLEQGPDVLARLRAGLATASTGKPLSQVTLRAPVLQPPTLRDFMCYEGHASMGGTWEVPEAFYRLPVFYFSNPLCIYGPGEEIPFPSATRKFDYELEIAAVVGVEGRNVAAADAMKHIAGFTIFNDWSSRDLQRDEMSMNLGPAKGKDSASSLGPWVATLDGLGALWRDGQLHAQCKLRVNGQEWASATTGGMHHDWGAIIERASRDSRIVPGDVIGSGTVAGGSIPEAIRLGRPARYLRPGDEVEVEVEGLGVLRNKLRGPVLSQDGYRYLAPTRKN